jgi:hypothetical protein
LTIFHSVNRIGQKFCELNLFRYMPYLKAERVQTQRICVFQVIQSLRKRSRLLSMEVISIRIVKSRIVRTYGTAIVRRVVFPAFTAVSVGKRLYRHD